MRETLVKTEEFKDSPVGRIPKDWEVFKLSEVVPRAEYGISVSLDDEVGIPVLRMNNLKNGEVDLTDLKKSASFKAASLLLQPLDVLFNRTNSIEHVGRTAIWRGQIKQASFASYLVRLIPEPSKLIPEYLNIWLNFPSTQLLIRRYATPGVHQVNINPTNLRKVLIALPKEVSEQRRIVEILGSMDETIAHTSSLIAKLKQMKAGLLHDLLTRGLDENGELRDAIGHPEQFKDSPLGQIPKDWEVKSLAEISRQITDGVHATPNYTSAGIPFISVNNLVGNCISFDSCQFISEAEHEILIQRCHPEQGDILLGKVATLGVVDVVLTDRKFSIFVQVALVKLKAGLIPKFIKYSITHQYLQDQIQQKASGTTIRYIGVEMIGKLLVKVPSKKEQESIAAILDTHDARICTEEAYRDKLKLQKQGLMHDLLTGKVRVKNAWI